MVAGMVCCGRVYAAARFAQVPAHARRARSGGKVRSRLGPGGQAINKLSTNVQLTHLPTGTRLTCQETRSRDRNRELARRRMSLVLEKLVRGESGGSRIDRTIEKERRKKSNKKKKAEASSEGQAARVSDYDCRVNNPSPFHQYYSR